MTLAGFLFGFLLATALAALAHLITGGGVGRLLLYWMVGQAGFWLGHLLGVLHWLAFGRMGTLWLGSAVLVSGGLLALAAVLTGPPRAASEE